ncbi:kinase-like domain-containing protein [Mycena filopes]|nr:kinase-like domain-containing protein [Mycena filopes]
MQLLRDNLIDATGDGTLQEDYSSFVALCRKATLLPTSFRCAGPLQEKELIGYGGSATVWRGTTDGTDVAIKSFRLYTQYPPISQRFIKETLLLRLVQHPNILRFLSVVDEPQRIGIVTPWYANGSIMRYIRMVQKPPLKELMEQVADGLHFLSQYEIVHGDLKGENILIDDNGKALIADFGLSSIRLRLNCSNSLAAGGLSTSPESVSSLAATILSASSAGGGTYRWMAPERLNPQAYELRTQQATKASDVYAFGMLVVEVFGGETPWSALRTEFVFINAIVANTRPPRPTSMPDDLWEIVTECWSQFPVDRPSIWQVYNRLACME